ncbi:MAG: RNA-binding protein [Verrucomicrobiales bacterium]|nr:RNA-binding protein [Verrucomicrobiales bacterium]MCP5525903.1 RNA-binding protein [Verrucomicrobiales bacterium]
MIPDHPSASGRPVHGAGGHRPPVEEETLRTERIQVERKCFIFALKENPRGRFLRITEDVNGRRDHIIVPAPGLEEFAQVVHDMATGSGADEAADTAQVAAGSEVPTE